MEKVDAGSDIVVALPINSAVLDGSKSVDDIGIKKWLWTQLQYVLLILFLLKKYILLLMHIFSFPP